MAYLSLIRPINLLLLGLVQVLIKYVLFHVFDVQTAMGTLQFVLLVIATLAIAAGGNVINDIYDQEIDRINKPDKRLVGTKISEKKAYTFFIILNIIGVGSGFILANQLGRPGLAATFIVISALLYIYSSQIKSMLLIGNFLISLLVAFSLLVVLIFDLYPIAPGGLSDAQKIVSGLVLDYAIFAFVVNFIREIVKDLEDINGDKNAGISTLPIALGRSRTRNLVFALGILLALAIVGYLYIYLYDKRIMVFYFLFLIVAPLIYFCTRAWTAETDKEYHQLSIILKIVMFTGICSMICYLYI